jgi:serine-type D-Ala-D-Ala carboxypeptidase/endopeptidase
MRSRCWLIALTVLVWFCGSSMADDSELAQKIDALVQPYLDESIAVGMTVGVVHGDKSLVRGYGRVDREDAKPPTGKTTYEIGSISKTFTGLLLADAVVQDQVRLDQPVAELLPSEVQMQQHGDGPVLLKHLATHVSGLPRMPNNLSPSDVSDPYADYRREDLYAFLSDHVPARGPAKEYEYSNLAFGLLGQLLADLAGKSYHELIRSRIADPLGMIDTSVELDDAAQSRLALPYNAALATDKNWLFQSIAGAGAVRSTVDDMLLYARAHLHPPADQVGEAIELAWAIHQPPLKNSDFAMGLGWHVARDGSTRWHNGQTGGYHSMILINRSSDLAVVVLSNTATMEIDVLAEQLVRALMGASEQPRQFPKSVSVSAEQMQRLVGRYQLAPNFILTAKIEDEKLMVGATGQPFLQVFPASVTKWNYRVVDASLSFELDEKGPARAVILHQNGLNQRATRLE